MAKRRKKHEVHEEHVNHERWLITYADMITLLMVLFIVLFAMGQTDLAKFEKLKESLNGAFGLSGGSAPIPGGDGVLSSGTSPIPMPGVAAAAEQRAVRDAQRVIEASARAELERTKGALDAALGAAGLHGTSIGTRVERRGLVVTIATDKVLFHPGRASLLPEGRTIVRQLGLALAKLPNAVRVEGHTDDVPIAGFYPSNWELSTARATTVLRELTDHTGVAAARLAAAGYADQKPVVANDSPEGRARNRRVEVLVEATTMEGGS